MQRFLPAAAAVCLGAAILVPMPSARAAERAIRLEVAPAEVGRYEKVEFRIHLDTRYQNPFDPDEVDLSLELTAPGGATLRLPAFSYQPYQRRKIARGAKQVDWLYPDGLPEWRARFAAVETGGYTAVARLRDRRGTAQSEAVRFTVGPSSRAGFVRVARKDPRFLELDNGRPFFAVGQNLAFIGDGQAINLARAEEVLAELADNGANFLRIWTCCQDWAMAVEARKSAWGRSWSGKPPIVPLPGREGDPAAPKCVKISGPDGTRLDVSPSHRVAVKPATDYVFSGWVRGQGGAKLELLLSNQPLGEAARAVSPDQAARFRYEWTSGQNQRWLDGLALRLQGAGTVWLGELSMKEAAGGPELLWEADVNRPVPGSYNPVDCFMLDQLVEAAEREGFYLQLCAITRDLYMDALKNEQSDEYGEAIRHAKNFMRYAVARWGYSTAVAVWEYFNEMNPGLPTDRFYTELGEYLEQVDPYRHLRATSTWAPSPKDWRHGELDVAEEHHYLRPTDGEDFRDEVAVVLDEVRLLRKHAPDKPVLLAEFGLALDNWQRSSYMTEDKRLVHFHNSLWASAFSGASGTAMFWWWEVLDREHAYRHYRPLAEFLADVPFNTAGLQAFTATLDSREVRVLGLKGTDRAYVWLFNPQATWWKQVVAKQTPQPVRGAELAIDGLADGAYRVVWWDTHQGKTLQEGKASVAGGKLRVKVPEFSEDVACRVVR